MKYIYKASFAALAIVPLLGLFSQNTYATMPSTFKDENFYNCVEQNFTWSYPGEIISETGLTDEQLGKMKELWCYYEEITDTSGLELMTSLEQADLVDNNLTTIDISKNTNLVRLNINDNNLTTIDMSKNVNLVWLYAAENNIATIDVSNNPNLTFLYTDGDVVIDTGIIPEKDGDKLKYDLSGLKFLDPESIAAIDEPVPQGGFGIFDYCASPDEYGYYYKEPQCTGDNITYDKENRVLYVNDFSALEDSPQIIEFLHPSPTHSITNTRGSSIAYAARAFAKLKLAEPEPESDSDEILSPDTGYFTKNFNAISTTLSTIVITFGAAIVWLLLKLNRKKYQN